ncbi:MAG: hypothetical protein CMK59_00990 [Proteobacteria bacterium]|nr:hypothetical protein [Pseudomonadota bacterium]
MQKALYKIGELSKKTGKTHRALRLYEDIGLLKPHQRTQSGYRLYAEEALVQIRWIERLQTLGFSLPEIQRFVEELRQQVKGVDLMNALRLFYVAKQEEINRTIEQLQLLQMELEKTLEFLSVCDGCHSKETLLGCLNCQKHDKDQSNWNELGRLKELKNSHKSSIGAQKPELSEQKQENNPEQELRNTVPELFPELIQAPLKAII